jgi:CIC family chloride channel protein
MAKSSKSSGRRWADSVGRWANDGRLRRHEDSLLLVVTLLVGAGVGLVVVAFILVTERLGSNLYPAEAAPWRRLVVPVAGALISGWLLVRHFPEARGSGIPQTKAVLFLERGYINLRTAVGKFVCSSISLASGISLGREGPTVHVGAGVASVLGRRLGLRPQRVQALIPVGTSAAVAAAFNTPIAGVLFTLEEILGDLHARVIGSVVISAATSWAVLNLLLGDEPLFHVPAYQLVHPLELPLYAFLGLAGGFVSVLFVKLLLWLRDRFKRLPRWSLALQPAAGGLVVGVFGWFVPEVLGVGYGHVGDALNGRLMFGTMALLLVLKVAATAACYGSGNAGGIFGPSLFIGAMLGGSVGSVAHSWLPDVTGSPGAYALVGMGTAFAGIVRAPMTSVIMIFEITRDYTIIVPVMIANLLSYFVSHRLQPRPVYEALLDQDGIKLPPSRTISGLPSVQRVMRPATDEEGRAADGPRNADDRGHCVYTDDPLDVALRRMGENDVQRLDVVSRDDPARRVGTLELGDLPKAYCGRGAARPASEPVRPDSARTLLSAVVAGILGLFLVGSVLVHQYYSGRQERARLAYVAGNELAEDSRYVEASERYRRALSLERNDRYRLALGVALAMAERPAEARLYLGQVLERDPANAPALLALARIEKLDGNVDAAVNEYRRAVDATWPSNDRGRREQVEAVFELVEVLRSAGRERQAIAELLRLSASHKDAATLERVGSALLELGSPHEAREVFLEAARIAPGDPRAHAGVGESEWFLGNVRAAARSLTEARRLNPDDEDVAERAAVVQRVLSMDPGLRGLRPAERRQRRMRLLEATLTSFQACAPRPYRSDADAIVGQAERALGPRAGRLPSAEQAEEYMQMAESLWALRAEACAGFPADPALSRIFASREN